MAKMFNRARMTVTSTGTGALSLGVAVAGYQTFSSAGALNGDVVSYAVEDGLKWEIGTGTYNSVAGTLSRTVTQSFDGTTYGTTAISVTTSAQVFISPLAADLQYGTSAGNLLQLDGSAKIPAVDGSLITGLNATNITNGTLSVSRGGTGLTSLNAGYIPYGNGTSAFLGSSGLTFDGSIVTIGYGSSNRGIQIRPSAGYSGYIQFTENAVDDRWSIGCAAGDGAFIWKTGAGFAGSEKMRIASDGAVGIGYTTTSGIGANGLAVSGNLGVGTASPVYGIDVRGTNAIIQAKATGTNGAAVLVLDGTDAGSYPGVAFKQGGTHYWSIQQRADTNLYIWRESGAGNTVIQSGNVGIGKSSNLGAKLEVNGALAVQGSGYPTTGYGWELLTESSSIAAQQSYNRTSGTWMSSKWYAADHYWLCSGSPAMTLDASGRLGIGTTSPSNLLTVDGSTPIAEIRSGGYLMLRPTANNWDMRLQAVSGNKLNVLSGGDLINPIITFVNGGNVGIGTSSPSTLLHVSQASTDFQARITGTSAANAGSLRAYNDGGQAVGFGVTGSTNAGYGANLCFLGSITNNPLIFLTNNTERARIDSSGNLLVGDTGTVGSSRFYAKNTAGTAGRFYNSAASQQSIAALVVDKADNTNTTSQVFVQFTINSQATGSGQINANGANAAAFGSYSDARLKENIMPLTSQLSNILALKPSEFDYFSGGHQIGFIAQEMQEVYPDVVGEGDDGMLMITGWSKTEARLVSAIQELAAEVATLKGQING